SRLHEVAKALMNFHPPFAVRAETQMAVEILTLFFAERPIEEEVNNPFEVATKHRVPTCCVR
ncbi:MAG TPA: hypothetical protein VIM68_00065, partial [Thermoanaerobaculia bacterium]